MEFNKKKVEGTKIIKVPRDHITSKLKGFAFVGFETRAQAIAAKKALNFMELFDKPEYTLRVALIVSA